MNKDIQALIEREAKEYADSQYADTEDKGLLYDETMRDYIQGARFALSLFKWRKVSEELPENNENLILKKESKLTTQPVLIKTVGGGLFVDYRVKTIHENLDGWVEFWNWTRFNNNQVTEWKPIE